MKNSQNAQTAVAQALSVLEDFCYETTDATYKGMGSENGGVVGMIEVFTSLVSASGETAALAGGISTALITTAAGLSIAIPTLVAHRLLLRKVDTLLLILDEASQRWRVRLSAERRG